MQETSFTQQTGIVITNFGNEVLLETHNGERIRAICRQSLPSLVTGDVVTWRANNTGLPSITDLHERRKVLAREVKSGQEKIIASNIDIALVVCTHKPALKIGLLDRYIAACEIAGITPVIIFNKIDSLPEKKHDAIMASLSVYRDIGYQVFVTSAKLCSGFDELSDFLQNRTSVLVGQSGVGKSSIINALIPAATPKIGNVSDSSNKGRHTTTHSEIYHFGKNACLIDSPGIREFGLRKVDAQTLANAFVEFRPFTDNCQFRDCQHTGEPGCAIQQAADEGRIKSDRLDSFRKILASFTEQ